MHRSGAIAPRITGLRIVCALAVVLVGSVACAPPGEEATRVKDPGHDIGLADVGEAQTWGGVDNVVPVSHLYISGQPDAEALAAAKGNGVTTVINLREPGESDWDERAAAESLGLEYFAVPIAGRAPDLDPAAVARITSLVQARETQKVLLHCSSGNRAAAWLATHLVQDHGLDLEASLAIARRAGLTKSAIEERVRRTLVTTPTAEAG